MSIEEQNITKLENDPVSKLLGGLKRVEAPGDFDFRVKAGIASGRPVNRSASWLPTTVRLAVPLGLLLVIGSYFGYNGLFTNNNVAVAPVVEVQSASVLPVTEIESLPPETKPSNEVIAQNGETKPAITDNNIVANNNKPTEKRIVLAGPSNRQPGGGSVDRASRISTPLKPKDPDTNSKMSRKDIDRNAGVSVQDILSNMGINADSSGKVGSVKQNSRADRSGLKAGDVIEAIDGQNLTEKTTFENKFVRKTLRVRRGGTSVQIDLKP